MCLEGIDTVDANVFICGDFNIWYEDALTQNVIDFCELMDMLQFVNKVNRITSHTGHMLDLVFYNIDHDLIHNLVVDEMCTISPVHMLIQFDIPFFKEGKQKKRIIFRNRNSLVPEVLVGRITQRIYDLQSEVCVHGGLAMDECLGCFCNLYNSVTREEYNEICPVIEKEIRVIDRSPWYNVDVANAKREKKRKERVWRRLRTEAARRDYQEARNRENMVIRNRKRDYYRQKVAEAGTDMSKLYDIVDNLTANKKKKRLPKGFSDEELAQNFLEFFTTKIRNVVDSFTDGNSEWVSNIPQFQGRAFSSFQEIDINKLKYIVQRMKLTYCDNDPVPMSEIVNRGEFVYFWNIILKIVNLSIGKRAVPSSEKQSLIKPTLKGSLNSQSLSSYRPISNLTFLSKIMENIILDQMISFLLETGVLPDEQSAYRQLYSTETAICSIVNNIILSMDEGKCGIFVLLDLSAAFDTVVHSLLLEDLKRIGMVGDALEYLKDYLQNRTYRVQIGKVFSEPELLGRGVP